MSLIDLLHIGEKTRRFLHLVGVDLKSIEKANVIRFKILGKTFFNIHDLPYGSSLQICSMSKIIRKHFLYKKSVTYFCVPFSLPTRAFKSSKVVKIFTIVFLHILSRKENSQNFLIFLLAQKCEFKIHS